MQTVRIGYQGKLRYIGSFDTQEQAALANEAARGMLRIETGSILSAEEIELNVKSAEEAALEAVRKAVLAKLNIKLAKEAALEVVRKSNKITLVRPSKPKSAKSNCLLPKPLKAYKELAASGSRIVGVYATGTRKKWVSFVGNPPLRFPHSVISHSAISLFLLESRS